MRATPGLAYKPSSSRSRPIISQREPSPFCSIATALMVVTTCTATEGMSGIFGMSIFRLLTFHSTCTCCTDTACIVVPDCDGRNGSGKEKVSADHLGGGNQSCFTWLTVCGSRLLQLHVCHHGSHVHIVCIHYATNACHGSQYLNYGLILPCMHACIQYCTGP